jgi:hypothetical protein
MLAVDMLAAAVMTAAAMEGAKGDVALIAADRTCGVVYRPVVTRR